MDLRNIYNVAILYIVQIFITVSDANLNETDTGQSTTETATTATTTTKSNDDRLFGNPFWLNFTIILFICIVILAITISLTFGIYKFRKEAKKRGHYKHKSRVYRAPEEQAETDYDMFTINKGSPEGEVNAAYIGSS